MTVDVKTFVNGMVKEIIEKVFINSKVFKEEAVLADEEDEDYFDYAAIDRRRVTKGNQKKDTENDFSLPDKKKSNSKFGDNFKVRIFLFKSKNSLDFNLFINETILDLKTKIADRLQKEQTLIEKFKLTHLKPDGMFYYLYKLLR
jgi:hypothetical protein